MDVLLIQNGVVKNVISADSVARAQTFFPAYTCVERAAGSTVGTGYTTTDNANFTAPAPPAPPVYSLDMPITRFAFLSRFTQTEMVEVHMGAQGTGAGPAQMAAYLTMLNSVAYVRLSDPVTVAGVEALATAGILTAARAATILTTPPVSSELVGGV